MRERSCSTAPRRMGVTIVEMGVEEKMAPEDQHGGYSHPTSHSTSSDLTTSLHTSWTDSMAILTCVAAREQVLVSTSLSTTLHFPPRSGCLAVLVDRAVLWPQVAADPGYRLERPALGIPRRDNQALVERVMVCGCRWANVVENVHFQALGQMGTKKAKMAMEEVNENKDPLSSSRLRSQVPLGCVR